MVHHDGIDFFRGLELVVDLHLYFHALRGDARCIRAAPRRRDGHRLPTGSSRCTPTPSTFSSCKCSDRPVPRIPRCPGG